MTTRTHRIGFGLLAAGVLALGLGALPAGAHITGDKDEVPAGAYTSVSFTVPHGCEDSPTRRLAFQIPDGILDAAPQVVAGWDVETAMEPLAEPVDGGHGDEQTERVSEITWTAQPGNELPSAYREVFTIGFKAPDTPGEELPFKIVQTCTEGETAWIEIPQEGEEEPAAPAAIVLVGASETSQGEESAAPVASEESAAEPIAASSDDDNSSNGLAIGGLVLGALGLAAGGAALVRTRSTS